MNLVKYKIFILLSLLLFACDNNEITSEQTDSFIKLYGSWNVDIGKDVKEFGNGYLILATVSSSNDPNKSDIALIKTDKFGNLEKMDTLTAGSGGVNLAGKLLVTDDGGVIVLGTYDDTLNNRTDIYLKKFTSNLEAQWEKIIGSSDNEKGVSIKKAATGYIIAASTTRENPVNNNLDGKWDILLTKIDDSGNVEWENTFGGSGDDISGDIVVKNNKYLIIGTTNSFNEPGQAKNNIIAIETNLAGNETDKITYGSSNDDFGNSVIETDEGGYLIIGTVENISGKNDLYILNVDNDIHNIIWNEPYGEALSDEGFDIIDSESGYVAVGSKELTTGKAAYYLKIDKQGTILSEKTYGGYNNQILYSIERTSDNAYVMVGSSGFDGNDMICLIKVNSEGEL